MAAENKLSDKRIRALLGKPQDKQQVISDGRGLSIRVSSAFFGGSFLAIESVTGRRAREISLLMKIFRRYPTTTT